MLAADALSISTRLLLGSLILIASSGCPNSHPTKLGAVAPSNNSQHYAAANADSSPLPSEHRSKTLHDLHEAPDKPLSQTVMSREQEATIAAILELRQQRGSILAHSELETAPPSDRRPDSQPTRPNDQHADFAAALRGLSELNSAISQDQLLPSSLQTSLAPLQPNSNPNSHCQVRAPESATSAATQASPEKRPSVVVPAAANTDVNLLDIAGSDLDSAAKPQPASAPSASDLPLLQTLQHTARQLREAARKSPANEAERSSGRQARYHALAELLEAEISSLPVSPDSALPPTDAARSSTSTPMP